MVDEILVLHEDVFEEFFEPCIPEGTEGGAFGEFGLLLWKDLEVVKKLPETVVWTVCECDCEWFVDPGFSFVNRHCYIVTRKHHYFMPVVFRSYRYRPTLTEIGRKRLFNRLDREYSKWLERKDI